MFFGGLTKAGNLIMDPIKEAYDANVQNIFKGKAKMLISQMDDAQAAVVGAAAVSYTHLTPACPYIQFSNLLSFSCL